MKKSFFLLFLICMFLFNCTKNEITQPERSIEELPMNNSAILDAEIISKLGPIRCQYPTLNITNYGGDGSAYYQAIEKQLNKYASCLNKSNHEECPIGQGDRGTVSFTLNLCRHHNYASCTDENGELTYTNLNPQSFNAKQYIQSKLNEQADCGQGCIALASNLSVYTDYLLCDCGIGSSSDDGTIPCEDIPFESHTNTTIFITASYYCCCLTDGGGAF